MSPSAKLDNKNECSYNGRRHIFIAKKAFTLKRIHVVGDRHDYWKTEKLFKKTRSGA